MLILPLGLIVLYRCEFFSEEVFRLQVRTDLVRFFADIPDHYFDLVDLTLQRAYQGVSFLNHLGFEYVLEIGSKVMLHFLNVGFIFILYYRKTFFYPLLDSI